MTRVRAVFQDVPHEAEPPLGLGDFDRIVVPAMVGVTMLAAYVPVRKAIRIAPTIALRYE